MGTPWRSLRSFSGDRVSGRSLVGLDTDSHDYRRRVRPRRRRLQSGHRLSRADGGTGPNPQLGRCGGCDEQADQDRRCSMTDADAFVSQPEGLAAIDGPAPAFEIALDITKHGLVGHRSRSSRVPQFGEPRRHVGRLRLSDRDLELSIVRMAVAGGGPNFPGSNGRSCSVWLSHTVRPYLPRRDARQGRIMRSS